uniref:Uncharacterized protein n=1 Tax=Anguilla anguilla TaxID=7936 RepID=A0A0E9T145_ANGAN
MQTLFSIEIYVKLHNIIHPKRFLLCFLQKKLDLGHVCTQLFGDRISFVWYCRTSNRTTQSLSV